MKKILRSVLNWFITDLGTKIMALVLAIIVWIYLNHEYTEKSELIEVPLKLISPPEIIAEGRDLQGKPVRSVKVILEGPRGLLKPHPAGVGEIRCIHQVEAPANLINEVVRVEDLKEKDFNLPARIKIREITPARIQITLMQKAQRYLRLDTKNCLKGNPLKGYQVQVKTEPSEILVQGPKNILDAYNEIPIEPIDIQYRNSSFSQPGRIVGMLGGYTVWTEDSFIVRVEIKGGLDERKLKAKINVLQPQGFPYTVKVKPTEIEICLKGPAAALRHLKEQHFNVFVNISNLYSDPQNIKPGTFKPWLEFALSPEAPEGISLAEPLKQVTVEVMELK